MFVVRKYILCIPKWNPNIPACPSFFSIFDCFDLIQSSMTLHLSLPHPCVCFWNFLISSLIYYCVFFLNGYSCDMTKGASQTVLVFFSLSSVFLTMVMSMSLSECGPSVNITFIVVWKQVGRRTWRRMALCSSCHSFKQTRGSEKCRQKHTD